MFVCGPRGYFYDAQAQVCGDERNTMQPPPNDCQYYTQPPPNDCQYYTQPPPNGCQYYTQSPPYGCQYYTQPPPNDCHGITLSHHFICSLLRQFGEFAELQSMVWQASRARQCLKFWYHMQGDGIGSLQVIQKRVCVDDLI